MRCEPSFLIYLLKHTKGIGNRSIIKILTKLKQQSWHWHSVAELASFAEMRSNHYRMFIEHFTFLWERRNYYYDEFSQSHFFTILDRVYPPYLKEIFNPPVGLFYSGDLTLLHEPCIAIVGARTYSGYGKRMAEKIIPTLVKEKIVIVSGLARGTDTYAHQLAMRSRGKTIGVIGCGLDVVYPKENHRMQEHMMKEHLVISEYPAGSKPLSHHFPERNRIIAGVSQGTCVIEAKKQSGSLITAQLALESGRDVFALPGQADFELSEGCHELIQQGAKCIWKSQHIIEEMIPNLKKK